MSSKIKMTKEQKRVFDKALSNSKDQQYDFVYFIDELGIVDGYWPRTKNNSPFEKKLNEFRTDSRWFMRAWLNQEDIEVE